MKKQIYVDVVTPLTPNFIMVGKASVPVEDFTDKELQEVAGEWCGDLIKKARDRRKHRQA
jgi:hypothetical protein